MLTSIFYMTKTCALETIPKHLKTRATLRDAGIILSVCMESINIPVLCTGVWFPP